MSALPARLAAFAAALAAATLGVAAPTAAAAADVPVPPTHGAFGPAGSAVCYYGACYTYVAGSQSVTGTGASVTMLQDRPEIDPSDPATHSLQELAVQSADQQQTVEVGWIVDAGLNGDTDPHLFVYHWVNGATSCYNGCGFVSTGGPVTAGSALTAGTSGQFAIDNVGGDWQIDYNGTEIGYFPGSLWSGTYTSYGLVQAFGEVSSTTAPTCTDMGNGTPGASPDSSYINNFSLSGTPTTPQLSVFDTDSTQYSSAQVTPTSYHLGGPGSGPC